jgi:hypothetical protein
LRFDQGFDLERAAENAVEIADGYHAVIADVADSDGEKSVEAPGDGPQFQENSIAAFFGQSALLFPRRVPLEEDAEPLSLFGGLGRVSAFLQEGLPKVSGAEEVGPHLKEAECDLHHFGIAGAQTGIEVMVGATGEAESAVVQVELFGRFEVSIGMSVALIRLLGGFVEAAM